MLDRSLEQALREVKRSSEMSLGMTSSHELEYGQLPCFSVSRKCPGFWRTGYVQHDSLLVEAVLAVCPIQSSRAALFGGGLWLALSWCGGKTT